MAEVIDLSMAVREPDAVLRELLADPAVHGVFRFAADLAKPVPTKAWLREADERLAAAPQAREAAGRLLGGYRRGARPVFDYVDTLLRGLVWLRSRVPGGETTALLCDLAATVAAPVRRGSAEIVAPKTAAAVAEALSGRPGDAPALALGRLSLTVRSRPLLTRVRAALERIRRERAWAPGEALEPAVADHGLDGEARKELDGGEWQAVFFHDRVESSTWERPYCTTDQVRFGRRHGRAWTVTPLAEVPPLVFSEAMRDVDLFVGVTSIAADDDWRDCGEDRFADYRRTPPWPTSPRPARPAATP
ncbi:hypothetical protein ACQPZJ_42375 [Actinoplanes sp. CA-054009]